MKLIRKLIKLVLMLFAGTFVIYWFNLDTKLVHKLFPILTAHYDRLPRDKRL